MLNEYVSSGYVLSKWLYDHPDEVVREWNGSKCTFFTYDRKTKKIYYCNPQNKVRNGWYESRGTVSVKWFEEKPERPYIPFLVLEDTEGALPF